MPQSTEVEILQALLRQLEEEGYAVYLHPNRKLLPTFLKTYIPDMIAIGQGKSIAVEISLRKTPQKTEAIERITKLFEGQDKWEFRVYWGSPTQSQAILEVQTKEAIQRRLVEVNTLRTAGHLGAALLLGWATFEAVARSTMSKHFQRPQSPRRLVELLASEGSVTPTEADQLRNLAQKRNALVHGDLEVVVSDLEITSFASVLETLLGELAN